MKSSTKINFFFLISSALFLLLASRSSLIYVFNNWDDANSYFTVGKSLFNGLVPYRDVFDQKGIYLYFFYGLAYLISHTTFLGVYILEIIVAFLSMAGLYRILKLYLKDNLAVILSSLTYVPIVTSRSFWWGGSAEEICLPLYIWGMYLILNYLMNDYASGRLMDNKTLICGGILAGMVANIKFTGLGFFFAWMMIVWLSFVAKGQFFKSINACILFLFGMCLPFIPWFIYFAVNNALYYWYWSYIYINVFLYPNEAGGGLYDKIYTLAKVLYWLIHDNFKYFVFVIPGIFFTLLAPKQRFITRITPAVLFGFMFLGIFIGGRTIPYYSLPLSTFAVFGFAFLGIIIEKLFNTNSLSIISKIICTSLALLFIWNTSMNIPFLNQKAEDYFLFRFRDEILQEENPTLLNIGCLDAGLYTLTGIVPNIRWFQTQTLDVPDKANNPYYEQDRYIKEGLTTFVLACDTYPETIFDNYELIDEAPYSYSGYDFTFYLFKLHQE